MWVLLVAICLETACDFDVRKFDTHKQCMVAQEKEIESWQVVENIKWLKIESRKANCIKL